MKLRAEVLNFIYLGENMGKYIVSACLLGKNCKYNGQNNYNKELHEFLKDKEYILVCPEVSGGLPIPRHPSEISSLSPLKIINNIGEDVTLNFINGAKLEWNKIKNEEIVCAILKEKSPSCGNKYRYDGTFKGKLIEGNGVFANILKNNNIKIFNEIDFINSLKENDRT